MIWASKSRASSLYIRVFFLFGRNRWSTFIQSPAISFRERVLSRPALQKRAVPRDVASVTESFLTSKANASELPTMTGVPGINPDCPAATETVPAMAVAGTGAGRRFCLILDHLPEPVGIYFGKGWLRLIYSHGTMALGSNLSFSRNNRGPASGRTDVYH